MAPVSTNPTSGIGDIDLFFFFQDDIQTILTEITGDVTDQIFSSVQNLDVLMMTVQSIEDSAPANAFPSTIKANINIFKTELIKYRNQFSQQLGEILPEVMFF